MATSDDNRERQSKVSSEGAEFERHVKEYLNRVFSSKGVPLYVMSEAEVLADSRLKKKFSIPVHEKKEVWGDVDLLVIDSKTRSPLAVISCKLSLHGRFSETLFYALVFKKMDPKTKVVFATPDKGRQANDNWQSEWGTASSPTRDRDFAEYFLDGVYIDNEYLKNKWGASGRTSLSGKIKDISDLANDLMQWSKEVR